MKTVQERSYLDQTHFYGKLWGFGAAFVICIFPVVLSIVFQTMPDWAGLGKGFLAVAPLFWTVGVVEIFTYVPMLGVGSSYLGFVTGNLSNLKVPCALNCLEHAGVQAGSDEGEVISTISTAVSSIVTMLIIILGVCLIIPLAPILTSEALEPAFDNLLPALFGGLAVVYIARNWKIAIAPLVLMLVVFIFIPGMGGLVSLMVPVGAIFTIVVSRILYKKGFLTKEEK